MRDRGKSLASGLGQYGITVNDVSPGFIDTIRDMDTHPEVTPERTKEFCQSSMSTAANGCSDKRAAGRAYAVQADPVGRLHCGDCSDSKGRQPFPGKMDDWSTREAKVSSG